MMDEIQNEVVFCYCEDCDESFSVVVRNSGERIYCPLCGKGATEE